jgi:hypothetical protein
MYLCKFKNALSVIPMFNKYLFRHWGCRDAQSDIAWADTRRAIVGTLSKYQDTFDINARLVVNQVSASAL